MLLIGALAADVTAEAIVRAVKAATRAAQPAGRARPGAIGTSADDRHNLAACRLRRAAARRRPVDWPARARRVGFLRRRAAPAGAAGLRDVSCRQHRRRLHGRRRQHRVSDRPRRVVVERVGRDRIHRARVVGRTAAVGVGARPRDSSPSAISSSGATGGSCAARPACSSGSCRCRSWPASCWGPRRSCRSCSTGRAGSAPSPPAASCSCTSSPAACSARRG